MQKAFYLHAGKMEADTFMGASSKWCEREVMPFVLGASGQKAVRIEMIRVAPPCGDRGNYTIKAYRSMCWAGLCSPRSRIREYSFATT